MRLPKEQQRLKWRGSVLVCVAIAWLVPCGCQGPELDRLDGSTSRLSTGDPIVDNGPPPTHPATHDTSSSSEASSSAQSSANNQAAIAENLNCGHREAALKHYERAEAYYLKVLNLDPENPVANHRLAVLADRRGDFATSERCYLTALRREPNNPDLLSDLGYSYSLQGRTAEAERFLLSALRANPQHRLALDNLSLLYAKLGDRDRTYEMLKRSVGEREARTRLAQLFPPRSAPAADDDTFTASFAPFSPHEVPTHDAPTQDVPTQRADSASPSLTTTAASVPESPSITAAPSTNAGPPTSQTAPGSVAAALPLPPMPSPPPAPPTGAAPQSSFEKHLADLMDRERQRALEQRQQQSVNTQPAPAVQPVAPSRQLSALPAAEPVPQPALRPQPEPWSAGNASVGTAAAARSVPTGQVPDDHINDAFSAIDREGTGNTLPSAPASDSAPRYQPSAPAPWSQLTGPAASALPPAQPANRAASVPSGTPDWPAIPTDAPNSTNGSSNTNPAPATPAATPPLPEPDPMSASASPTATTASRTPATAVSATTSGAVPGQPSAAASRNGWDPELDPPTPEWRKAMNLNSPEAAPTAATAGTAAPSTAVPAWQDRSPRIVATNVTPKGSATPAPSPRTADALDEFEAQLRKNNPGVAAGKSFSNSAAVAKPAVQPLPRDQRAAANKPTQPTDSSAAGVQPWSVRIQPRRDPPPLFGPDDASPAPKKQSADKQNGFETGTNWSDVPPWPGAPSSGTAAGTSTSTDGGPTIRPGQ